MKKTLRFSLLSLLMLFGMSTAWAGSIEFAKLTPSLENNKQYLDAFDGGDFTVTFAGGANTGKYYNTGLGIRIYASENGTMTIAAKTGKLTKILVTFSDATNRPTSDNVVDKGTFDSKTGMWTGDAEKVVFTASGSGQWRVQKIATNDDVEAPVTPTEGQTAETAINVTRALAIIDALADGGTTPFTYYVKGTVKAVKEISVQYGNGTFTIADAGSEAVLTAFRVMGLENKKFTNVDALQDGDEVVVFGTLQKYVSGETKTAQIAQSGGYVYSINGKTKDDTPNPEDAITKGLTAEAPMTAEEAIAYINAFTDGFTTEKQYYVKGKVTGNIDYSADYFNMTFNMGDLIAFRMKGLENKEIKSADFLKADDEVVVLAKLQKYMDNNVAKPELSTGYIYSLNGKTKDDTPVEPVTFVGDGSETNPYIVADLKQMTEDIYPAEKVWVKGVIVGSAKNAIALNAEDVVSNIAIGDAVGAEVFVPVELKNATDFRTLLNVKDTPANIGKEVKLFGKITKYFSTTGVKELEKAIFGETVINGIQTISTVAEQGKMFNLQGQRVARGYKGIMIQNGKKVLVK